MKQKTSKVLFWTMIAIAVVWVLFILSFLFTTDGIIEFWAWGLLAIITAKKKGRKSRIISNTSNT